MKKPGFIFFLLLFQAFSVIYAQDIAVRALLDTNRALIGDQIKLKLLVEKPSRGWDVRFPVFKDTISGKIEVISASPVDTAQARQSKVILSQELLIAVFDTGFFEVPSFAFSVHGEGLYDTLNSLPVGFEILSVKADSALHDIKAIYNAPVTLKELTPYIAGIIIAGLLIWILIYYVNRRKATLKGKHVHMISRKKTVEPPDKIALLELEKLKEERPWLHDKIKYYYIQISEILRVYIEGRYNTPALEQTTDEILYSLKSLVSETDDFNKLSGILHLADLVKFAKVIPGVGENAAQVDMAIEFVRDSSRIISIESPDEKNENVLDEKK
jgi:hypothetical protein